MKVGGFSQRNWPPLRLRLTCRLCFALLSSKPIWRCSANTGRRFFLRRSVGSANLSVSLDAPNAQTAVNSPRGNFYTGLDGAGVETLALRQNLARIRACDKEAVHAQRHVVPIILAPARRRE